MDRMRALAGAALVGMAAAAGCSGGGGSSPLPKASTAPTSAKFSISVPLNQSSSSVRKPNFDAPGGTQSVSISLTSVNGTKQSGSTPTVANLSASTAGCTAGSSTLTCTVTVNAVPGTDLYSVTSYPQPNAQGTAIATGTASVTAVEGQTTTAPVTLTGTIASITLALGTPPIGGVANTIPLVVIAKDSSGATIMGTYSTPIALTDSDTSGATKLSSTSIADSTAAAAVTIAYNGGALASAPSIGAAAGSVSATALPFSVNNDYSAQDGASLSYAMTASWTRTPAGGTPQPEATASGTMDATYSTGATFNGVSNLIKVHETAASLGGFFFIGNGATQDYYYQWTPTKTGANLFEVAWQDTYTDTQNNVQHYTTIASGAGWQIAQVPFASGNSWNAGAAYTSTYSAPEYDSSTGAVTGSYSDTYTGNLDGSYHDVYSSKMNDNSYSYNDDTQVNSDDSVLETTSRADSASASTDVYTIGTPEPAPTGTPGTAIKYTDTYTQSSPAPQATSTPDVWYGPNWYPGGKAPSPLQTDVTTDKGTGAIPADCNVPSTLATTAEHLQEISNGIDPWGYTYTTTTDYYYTAGVGLVCGLTDEIETEFDTETTGQPRGTNEWKAVQSLTAATLQSALRKTNSMSQAAAFASAGLQASVSHMQQRFMAQNRAARVQRHVQGIIRAHHAR